ncbi:MAG: F0F1 ATP synthase subunit A [Bacteroidia bacterium]|nr:F0F1 ATP synthase subunit A [Bacteroidia bacterium]MBT8268034.1 F0F1 ATP synthase subunit A [Bacteroidia bacterium]NNF83469.1 F0F1 ATP synthase subunit A [Flavobacteriaceae bacterium]NNK71284.1 F0F1 ATP synthase subunit A [Flavobacteriaceae bacterium]NNL79833.1 F0F1 ATP synthase subunit A [Flavobacteriaceae bacterium]
MQINTFKLLFLSLFLALSFSGFATENKDAEGGDEELNIAEMILHHVSDNHSFHILDWDGHPVSVPLPVILWTNEGLVTFMSSEFHHDEDGKVVVEKKGQKLTYYHGKIYYANDSADASGKYVSVDEEGHATNARMLDLSVTKNVFSMLMSMIVLMLIFIGSARAYKKSENNIPRGIARFTEPLILFVKNDIAIPNIGEKKHKKFLPYLLTIFFFIWINNIFGLIPFFPFSANLSGNIAFTFALACLTFIITTLNGNKDYWKHIFWMPGVPVPMKLFLAPIELIGVFTKPIALFIRLFANITAGHIVILALISLIFVFRNMYGDVAGYAVSPVSVAFVVFISLIEILVVAIQAYIFTILSALYFGMATAEHDDH